MYTRHVEALKHSCQYPQESNDESLKPRAPLGSERFKFRKKCKTSTCCDGSLGLGNQPQSN